MPQGPYVVRKALRVENTILPNVNVYQAIEDVRQGRTVP